MSSGFNEEMKRIIAEGHCGPIQSYACQPILPLEDIRSETLKPEHLDELRALADGCLEAVYHVRLHAARLVGNDDDRWWIQSSLMYAMNTGLRAGYFLKAGLEDEILRAYPSSPAISGAGITRGNAHRLSTAIALEVACRAWSEIYRAEGMKPTSAAMAYTFRRPLVRMQPSDEAGFPVFKRKHIASVVKAIRDFPDFDAEEILGRIQWENSKVKERRGLVEPRNDGVGVCTVLFLAANPDTKNQLTLDVEYREIENKIRASDYRDSIRLISKWAVQPDDLIQYLNEVRPNIVHFSGHGSESLEIILQDNKRQATPVGKDAILHLFSTMKDNIRLVFLNACFTHSHTEAISKVIDCTIGMRREISDNAAITFAAGFYSALGFGRSIQEAFDQGIVALKLEDIIEQDIPELLVREGIDPTEIFLVKH